MTNWIHWERIGEYHVWCKEDYHHQTSWTVTEGEKPWGRSPQYWTREDALKAKGLTP